MHPDLATYLDAVVERLRDLEAIWLIGSAATGAYVHGVSDVDVIGVSAGALREDEKRAITTDLGHERLPCPARKLELPIYTQAAIERPSAQPRLELNLNTGPDEHNTTISDPFWFVLDLAAAREQAKPLHGPSPSALLGEVPRPLVLDALRQALRWYEREEPTSPSGVLNACRGASLRAGRRVLEQAGGRCLGPLAGAGSVCRGSRAGPPGGRSGRSTGGRGGRGDHRAGARTPGLLT